MLSISSHRRHLFHFAALLETLLFVRSEAWRRTRSPHYKQKIAKDSKTPLKFLEEGPQNLGGPVHNEFRNKSCCLEPLPAVRAACCVVRPAGGRGAGGNGQRRGLTRWADNQAGRHSVRCDPRRDSNDGNDDMDGSSAAGLLATAPGVARRRASRCAWRPCQGSGSTPAPARCVRGAALSAHAAAAARRASGAWLAGTR